MQTPSGRPCPDPLHETYQHHRVDGIAPGQESKAYNGATGFSITAHGHHILVPNEAWPGFCVADSRKRVMLTMMLANSPREKPKASSSEQNSLQTHDAGVR